MKLIDLAQSKKNLGFTIVELLLSVAIIMLLAGVGAVSLNNFNARQKIGSTKEDIITNLRLARNYATSMQMPRGFTGTLDFIKVVFLGSNISVSAVRTGDLEEENFFTKTILPSGIGISIVPEVVSIDFDSYKGNYLGTGDIKIIVYSSEVGVTGVVEINNSGLINEK